MYNLNDQIIVYLVSQILENTAIQRKTEKHDLQINAGFNCHFYDHYLINFFLLKTTDMNLK